MDRGLWVTWYDLSREGKDAYLKWAHEQYIPAMLKRAGILWGCHYEEVQKAIRANVKHVDDPAVPRGSQFMMLFGAESADVFGKSTPSDIHSELSEADSKMLALRVGARTNIMAEFGRVLGPEGPDYKEGMTLAPCIQFGTYNTDWQNEEELLAYYGQGRMPNMKVIPGTVRARKLVSVSGWAKHGVLYEFTSLEARNKHFVPGKSLNMEKWSTMVSRLTHAPGSANLALRIWPPLTHQV